MKKDCINYYQEKRKNKDNYVYILSRCKRYKKGYKVLLKCLGVPCEGIPCNMFNCKYYIKKGSYIKVNK